MGILADYMWDKYQSGKQSDFAEGVQGLLGAQGVEGGEPGTGLLGAGIDDPAARAQFAQGLMTLPGGQKIGTDFMQQLFQGQDMDERQMQQQIGDYQAAMSRQQNQNLWQQGANKRKQEWDFKLAKAKRIGNFSDENQRLNSENTIRDDFTTQIKPIQQSMERFNQTTQLLDRVGGFDKMNGVDDLVMTKNLIKMILPGEAVMSDDATAAQLASQGYQGLAKTFMQLVKGEGTLDKSQRSEIYGTMQGMAQGAFEEGGNIREQFQGIVDDTPGLRANSIMRERKQMNAYQGGGLLPPPQVQEYSQENRKIRTSLEALEPGEEMQVGNFIYKIDIRTGQMMRQKTAQDGGVVQR